MKIFLLILVTCSFVYVSMCTQMRTGDKPPDLSEQSVGWPLSCFAGYLKETDETADYGLLKVFLHLREFRPKPFGLMVDIAVLATLLFGTACFLNWLTDNVKSKFTPGVLFGIILFAAIDISTRLPWATIRSQLDALETLEVALLIYARKLVWAAVFVSCATLPAKLIGLSHGLWLRKYAEPSDETKSPSSSEFTS